MLSTRLATILALAAAVPAAAQSPLEFTIDAAATQFSYGGSTSLGPIVGNPPSFGLTGTVRARLTPGPNRPVGEVRFAPGGDALVVPDIDAEIPNPVVFLPPLATIEITDLHLEITSNPTPVGSGGGFTTNAVATVLSGTSTVTPLGGSPSVTDLTGNTSTPQPFSGTVTTGGGQTRIEGPLLINFQFVDSGSGLTATIDVSGNFAADFVAPPPSVYCTAAPNSTGSAAQIGTTGSTSLFAADLELRAAMLPSGSLGYFLFSETQDFVPGFGGGSGNLCLGGAIFRLSSFVQSSGPGGTVALPLPFGGLPPGASLDIGESWSFQYWFRDTTAGGAATSNTTDGVEVLFAP